MKEKIRLECDKEILNSLYNAVNISNDSIDRMFEEFARDYSAKIFSEKARLLENSNYNTNISNKKEFDYGKAIRKIPSWAVKPQLNTHKIIRAYFEIEEKDKVVTVEQLQNRCSDREKYPETYVQKFTQNFAQMKIDNGNSNGKVFETIGDTIFIWDEVKETLLKFKDSFISKDSQIKNKSDKTAKTITSQMIVKTYEIGKKIHLGLLEKSDGPTLINLATSMPIEHADHYINTLLNMINGQETKFKILPEAKRYFEEQITKDFNCA